MSDGMSEYWKQRKRDEFEKKIVVEKMVKTARDSVARFVGRPDLVHKRNPIFILKGTVLNIKDVQGDILNLAGIKPIEVLGQLEVEGVVPMEISMTRYTKKEPDEE